MPAHIRKEKSGRLQEFVNIHSAARWGTDFVKQLITASNAAEQVSSRPRLTAQIMDSLYKNSKTRIFVFNESSITALSKTRPVSEEMLAQALEPLTKDPANQVYLFSPLDKTTLSETWGNKAIHLVSEHGYEYSEPTPPETTRSWKALVPTLDISFKESIRPVFEYFVKRTPGAIFLETSTSMILDLTKSDLHVTKRRLKDFRSYIETSHTHVNVTVTDTSLTARAYECNLIYITSEVLQKDADLWIFFGELPPLSTLLEKRLSSKKNYVVCDIGAKSETSDFFLPNSISMIEVLRQVSDQN